MWRGLCLGASTLALAAAGCGGGKASDAPSACLQAQPCGGDVVGTWRWLGGCVNPAALSSVVAACPAWTVDGTIDISGTATFRADLSYSFDVAETITVSQGIPLSCTSFASCADVQADLAASMMDSTVTCTGTTTCNCVATSSIPQTQADGTYVISGSNITLTNPSSTNPTMDVYCVQGSTLHLMSFTTSNGQTKILADDVAVRE
jgi:hypothetical protein